MKTIKGMVHTAAKQATGRSREGIVKGIREAWEDKQMASVEVEYASAKGKRSDAVASSHLDVPRKMAEDLKIGDRVRVTTTVEKLS